jgi:hypothetical protein
LENFYLTVPSGSVGVPLNSTTRKIDTVNLLFNVRTMSPSFYGYVWKDNCNPVDVLNECGNALESVKNAAPDSDLFYIFITSSLGSYSVVIGASHPFMFSNPAISSRLFQTPFLDFLHYSNCDCKDFMVLDHLLLQAHFSKRIYKNALNLGNAGARLSESEACFVKFDITRNSCDINFLCESWPENVSLSNCFNLVDGTDGEWKLQHAFKSGCAYTLDIVSDYIRSGWSYENISSKIRSEVFQGEYSSL